MRTKRFDPKEMNETISIGAMEIRATNLVYYDSAEIDGYQFYVADTPKRRSDGLSGLAALDKAGMVFVYEEDNINPFHMVDMLFDLDIAFYDVSGNLIKYGTYNAGYKGPIFSPKPYRYVVEAMAGTMNMQKLNVKNMKKKKGYGKG